MADAVLAALPPPPPFQHFQIGPFMITVHGVLILIPIAPAVALTLPRWRARGGSGELLSEVTIWAVAGGVVGARLYHVITSWTMGALFIRLQRRARLLAGSGLPSSASGKLAAAALTTKQ